MTIRQDVFVEGVPAPLQHVFSQAIVTKKKVYCSGAIGLDSKTGKLAEGGVKAETVRISVSEQEYCNSIVYEC